MFIYINGKKYVRLTLGKTDFDLECPVDWDKLWASIDKSIKEIGDAHYGVSE